MSAKQIITFLKKEGFVLFRTKGSHFHYRKTVAGKSYLVTVAYHGNKDIPIPTLNSIIRQSGIPKNTWMQ